MEKRTIYYIAGLLAAASLVLASCTAETAGTVENVADGYDDAYYAAAATVGSDDSAFVAGDGGGIIVFGFEGGGVLVNVDCGTVWTVENTATDLFDAIPDAAAGTLTVTAGANTDARTRSCTLTLMTLNTRTVFATIDVSQASYIAPELSVDTDEWHFAATADLTAEIGVFCTLDWDVESVSADWLSASKTGDSLILSASENDGTDERSCRVVLSCSDGLTEAELVVAVYQDARAYVRLSSKTLSFYLPDTRQSVTVDSNYEWDFSYDASNGWLVVERNGSMLQFAATDSDVSGGECIVTVTAGDGAGNVAEASVIATLTDADPLILTFTTTAANSGVALPLAGTVNCMVDWGDGGAIETVTSANPSHTYAAAGDYDVAVYGRVSSLSYYGVTASKAANITLTGVKQWGDTGLVSLAYAFYYCTNFSSIPETTGNALANVASFDYAFFYTGLASIPADLFTASVDATSFSYAFAYTPVSEIPGGLFDTNAKAQFVRATFAMTDIAEIPAGLFDSCTAVTTFEACFDGLGITSVPAGLFDKCASASNFTSVFYMCKALTDIPSGLFANTSATDMTFVFGECSSLTEVPSGLFSGCGKVTTFQNAFYNCSKLASLPESGLFAGCSSAVKFNGTFQYCTKLASVPSATFSGCRAATSFEELFYGCTYLKEVGQGLFDDCVGATDFYYAFFRCSFLASVPSDLFDSCTKATNFECTFSTDTQLNCDITAMFSKCLNATDFYHTFNSCTALESESPYSTLSDGTKVHLYERKDHTDTFSAPTKYSACFYRCTKMADYDDLVAAGWTN